MIGRYKNGDWEEFEVKNGKKHGKAIYYYSPNNNLSRKYEILNYTNGIRQGKAILYWTGKFEEHHEERNYIDGKVQGQAIYYYDFLQKERIVYNYIDGVRQNKAIKYSYDGKEKVIYCNKEENKPDNAYKISNSKEETLKKGNIIKYENGDYEEVELVNGKKHGKATYYYSSSQKYDLDNYKVPIEYKTVNYVNGVLHGKAIHYYKNGTREEFNYINGVLNGKVIQYCKDGNTGERTYINGVLEGKVVWYFAGEKVECDYVNGIKHGTETYYHFGLGEKEEFYYINGQRQEKSTCYYSNGFREERTWINGEIQGKAIYYWAGKFEGDYEERNYVDGKVQGKAMIHCKDGGKIELYYIDSQRYFIKRDPVRNKKYILIEKEDCKQWLFLDNMFEKITRKIIEYNENNIIDTLDESYFDDGSLSVKFLLYKKDIDTEIDCLTECYFENGKLSSRDISYKNNGINKIKDFSEHYFKNNILSNRKVEYYDYKDEKGNEIEKIDEDYFETGILESRIIEYKNIVSFENINSFFDKKFINEIKRIDVLYNSNGILTTVTAYPSLDSNTYFSSQSIKYDELGNIISSVVYLKREREIHLYENNRLKKSTYKKYINGDWEEYKIIYYDEAGNKTENIYDIEEEKEGIFGKIFGAFGNSVSKKVRETDFKETLININETLDKYKK